MTRRDRHTVATWTGMRALQDNRYLGRLRDRRWRRILVLIIAAGWLLTALTWGFFGERMRALWIAGMVVTGVAWLLLALATRNLSNTVDAFADERDRVIRDRAHRLAYWTLGVPLGALIGFALGALLKRTREDGTMLLQRGDLYWLGAAAFTLFVLYGVLPMAIIAWTEPDLPHDEWDEELAPGLDADPYRRG